MHSLFLCYTIANGEMAEWSIAAVLKTVEGQPSQGSNPCLSANHFFFLSMTVDMISLKKLILVFIAVVVFIAFILVALTRLVKPDLIRDYVNTELTALTGQPSHVNGHIYWQLLPQPGVRVTDVVVGNLENKPLYTLHLNNLLFNLNITPLFRGKLVFSEISVNGMTLNIYLDNEAAIHPGMNSPLVGEKKSKSLHERFAVEHFSLSQGNVHLFAQDKKISLHKLQVIAEQLDLNKAPFPVRINAQIEAFKKEELVAKTQATYKGNTALSPQFVVDPVSNLEQFSLDGQLILHGLNIERLAIQRVNGNMQLNKGLFIINPLTIVLYHGEAVGDLKYDFYTKKLVINQAGTGLHTKKLLTDLINKPFLGGILDFSLHTNIDFTPAKAWESIITGSGSLDIRDGELETLNLNNIIDLVTNRLEDRIEGKKINIQTLLTDDALEQANVFTGSTPFKFANMHYQFNKTKLITDSLILQTTQLHLSGKGEVNFNDRTLNTVIAVKVITDNPALLQVQNLLGGSIPLAIRGPLSKPFLLPDLKNMPAAFTKRWVHESLTQPVRNLKNQVQNFLSKAKI